MNENENETPEKKTSVWNKHPEDLTVRDNLVVGSIVTVAFTAATLAIPAAFIAGAALIDEFRSRRHFKRLEQKLNNEKKD